MMFWSKLLGRLKYKHRRPAITLRTYNCAKVFKGSYIGGGTNEFERTMMCGYDVLDGEVSEKRLRPILVKGTNSEGTLFKLQTVVVYPRTEAAMISATNGRRVFKLGLVKARKGSRSAIFRMRL